MAHTIGRLYFVADENVNADLEPTPAEIGDTQESALDAAAAKVRARREEQVPHLEQTGMSASSPKLTVAEHSGHKRFMCGAT